MVKHSGMSLSARGGGRAAAGKDPFLLVVQHHATSFLSTINALHTRGFQGRVVRLDDGIDALEFLLCAGKYQQRSPTTPRLILADTRTPLMGGIRLLQTMQASDELCAIPVVLFNSSWCRRGKEEQPGLGAVNFISSQMAYSYQRESISKVLELWGPTPVVMNR